MPKVKKIDGEPVALCHRCEHRARFKETGHGPRCECGSEGANWSCYMYRPVQPVVLRANGGERRSLLLPSMLCGRSHGVGLMDAELRTEILKRPVRVVYYWAPKEDK